MANSPVHSLLEMPSPFEGSLTATDSTGQSLTVVDGPRVPAAPASTGSGLPSITDVQSDAGEVHYRVEFHEPAVQAAEE